MGRKPTITRDKLLDLAEIIVRNEGASGLTIEALARAAGISKGGVQYSFSSKEDLIGALIRRWTDQFDDLMGDIEGLSAAELVRKYLGVMRSSQAAMHARMAGMMITHIQNPQNMLQTRDWYRMMFSTLAGDSPEARAARVAFLAAEGLFLMRISGIDEDGEWSGFLDDVEALFESLMRAGGGAA